MVNGVFTDSLAATDRGLHYGDGLFETIAVIEGTPRLWDSHMERLAKGCEVLHLPFPDASLLKNELETLCRAQERAVVKIIITRGSGGRGYAIPEDIEVTRSLYCYPWPDYSAFFNGVNLRLCETRLACNPALAGIKHLNRLEQVLARSEWNDPAVHEGVMCDLNGRVVEGTMSNLFWLKNGNLFTPDLSQCGVAGVMRAQVLELAKQLGITTSFMSITPDELLSMDEIFITNSLMGIQQVVSFEGKEFSHGPITKKLQMAMKSKLGD